MAAENLGTLTADLVANTGGFEKGMDRAQRALKATAKEAAYQGSQLEKLVGQIDPVTGALSKLDKQQQQLDAHFKAGRLPLEDYRQFSKILDQQKNSAATAATGFQKLDRQMASNGQTLKQYQNNLRNVPAQFTDIFTSLQGGQAPLTVLIQQGGQLKDMFGGIGPAAKALGGYVLGLVNPFTVAAAAAVGLAVAYKQGSDETTAYQTAIALTGNTAGTSADQLAGLAQQVAATSGTVGKASEVLAQLAGSTRIPVESFEMIAEAAVKFESATGQAASETVANFEKIAKDPVKAILALNESMNFLTASTYEQIKALQDQGDASGAARIADEEYTKALNDRSDTIKKNLGSIETGWNGVKNAAKKAWDAALNIGREDTLDQQIAKLDKQLNDIADAQANKNKRNARGQLVDPLSALTPDDTFRQEALQRQKTDLLVQKSEQQKRDQAKATSQQAQQLALQDQQVLDKIRDDSATNADKRAKAQADYTALVNRRAQEAIRTGDASLAISQEQQAKDRAAIDDKYADRKIAKAKAYVEDAGTKELDQAKQQYAVLQQQSQQLDEQTGKMKALGPEQRELIKWEQELADIKNKQTLTAAQKSLLATADQITAQKKVNAELEKDTEARKASAEQAQQLAEFTQAQADTLSRFQQGLDNQVAGVGLGEEGRRRLQDDLALQNDYANQVERLRRDKLSGKITQDTYDKETAILQDTLDKQRQAYVDNYAKIDVARSQWQNGANAALQDYLYDVGDVAGQTYTLFSDSFKGLEDSLVDFVTSGKLSFKSLADSILSDIARIIIRTQVLGPILSSLGVGGGAIGGAAVGGVTSLLGGGGVSGLLSNISTVVSVAGSSFGKAVTAGFNSGEGIIGGIQNAFGSGADYIKSAITSGFTSGSATAANVASNFAASSAAGASQAGYTGSAFQGYVAGQNASASLASLSNALSYIGAAYSVLTSFQQYGVKGAATTAGFAGAGALVGSFVGPIGTAAGAALGSVLGSFVSGKLFGGSGEKYPDLSTSAQGTYSGGQYTTGGIVQGWQTKAPKYGDAVDAQLNATVNKFAKTLGDLYTAFGASTQVYAYDMLQVRKTSGKYSTTFGATIDGGSVNDLNIHQQFSAADAAEALQHNYDDIMGTFLAKAIVSSKSLPDYFRAQFTEFANDWDTTADEVIKAIEGVFTRFNGVNDALSLINVNNLKLNDTGLQASDAILNMIAAMSDLDTTTATAKEKVDALNKAVGTYYQAFFTADEQFADLTKSLQNAFGGLGLKLPDTRSAYRDMVEDIDVTTAAGQAMFATLVGLAQNADSYYSGLEQTAKAAADAAKAAADAAAQAAKDALMTGVNDAYSALQRAISAQQKIAADAYNALTTSLNDMLDTANSRVSDLTSVATDLDRALKALRGTSDDATKMLRAQALATLASATATIKAGGTLANFSGLNDALDVVSSNTTDLYSSLEQFNADQDRTANVIAQLNDVNGKQLTSAQATVKSLQDQLALAQKNYDAQQTQFQAQLDSAQAQLDALNGVDTSVKTVADAVKAMSAAIVAALAGKPSSGTGSAQANTPANNATLVNTLYQQLFGRTPDAGENKYWADRLSSGNLPYNEIVANMTKYASAADKAAMAALQGRATGGAVSGLSWVGENGPEIIATGGAQVYSAAQSKAIMSGTGSSVAEEVKELREFTVAALSQIALNTADTAKNTKPIPQWDRNGLPATNPESVF